MFSSETTYVLLYYSFLIHFVAGSKKIKFILRGLIELHTGPPALSGGRHCLFWRTEVAVLSPKKKITCIACRNS